MLYDKTREEENSMETQYLMEMDQFINIIEKERKSINKDTYSMSIREIVSLYKDKKINLEPIYQRIYRWDEIKASKLIESIILGIPLPPIFVSVRNGKWDIVDGIQRLSTIFWFYGILEEKQMPLNLVGLEKLEEFNGLKKEDIFQEVLFKYFEMTRLDIILLVSDTLDSEFELFSRLNTGGVNLSPQEIRNFLMVKMNSQLYEKLREIITGNKDIIKILSISDKQIKEDYAMEIMVYFLIISKSEKYIIGYEKNAQKYKNSRERFIDEALKLVLENPLDNENEIKNIKEILNKIKIDLGLSPFKKGTKFSPFLFVILISYIYKNIGNLQKLNLREIKENLIKNPQYINLSKTGTVVVGQFVDGIKLGAKLKNE